MGRRSRLRPILAPLSPPSPPCSPSPAAAGEGGAPRLVVRRPCVAVAGFPAGARRPLVSAVLHHASRLTRARRSVGAANLRTVIPDLIRNPGAGRPASQRGPDGPSLAAGTQIPNTLLPIPSSCPDSSVMRVPHGVGTASCMSRPLRRAESRTSGASRQGTNRDFAKGRRYDARFACQRANLRPPLINWN